jgi:hypothetical protein
MVVSILGPENVGMTHWVVLRRTGRGWEVLLRRQQAAVLTAAGRDIQESVSIYRAGDPRCCPSGGTKVRSWRWNGRSFVASAWVRDVPTRFDSPSGNIRCWMYDGTRSDLTRAVGCFSKTPPRFVRLSPDGRLTISRNRSDCGCDEPKNRTLAYGEQITVGRFRCRSLQIGVRCTVVSFGRGFLINRDGVTRVG